MSLVRRSNNWYLPRIWTSRTLLLWTLTLKNEDRVQSVWSLNLRQD